MHLGPCHTCGGTGVVDYGHFGARPTDPATSHAASVRQDPDIRAFTYRSRQAQLLFWFYDNDSTAQQAALALWPDAGVSTLEGARRRVSDLARAGYLCDSGRRDYNPGSRDESIVWSITVTGIRKLQDMEYPGMDLDVLL